MRRLWQWIAPAAVTAIGAAALTWFVSAQQLAGEIGSSAAARLGPSAEWAAIVVDGRDVHIYGTAMDPRSPGQVHAALARIRGVRRIRNRAFVPPLKAPFNFTISRTAGGIEMSGYVPSHQSRARILDAVGYYGQPVTDNTAIARGGSDDFEPIVFFAVAQLAALDEGTVFVSDRNVSIRGDSRDRRSYDRLMATLAGPVPGNGRIAGVDVAPPLARPFGWRADIGPLGLKISGHRRRSDTIAAIREHVDKTAPGLPIESNLLPARGAPPGFPDAVDFALDQILRFRQGAIAVVDQEISAKGTAKDMESYHALKAAFNAGPPGGFTVILADIVPPRAIPYTWSARLDDDRVIIDGYVPSPEARALVLDAVADTLPGKPVTDNMELATGVSPGFADLTGFALERLAALSSGEVHLIDNGLTVRGVAANAKSYQGSLQALQHQAPAGGVVLEYDVKPPAISPYILNIAFDGANAAVSGFVPSVRARLAVRDALLAGLPDIPVRDDTDIGHGAPEGFVEQAEFAIAQLARLQSGEIAIADADLSIRGLARTPRDYSEILAALHARDNSDSGPDASNVLPPSVHPFDWQLAVSGGEARLSGHVPSPESREFVQAAVRQALAPSQPNLKVVDESLIAAGAPDGFEAMAKFAVSQLAQMSEGASGLSDTALTLAGIAADPERYGAIRDAVAEARQGRGESRFAEIDMSGVTPPVVAPYQWRGTRTAEAVVLSGFVPGPAARDTIVEQARSAFPGGKLEDRQRWGAGAPDGLAERVSFVIRQLARLREGELILTVGELILSGVANSPADYAALLADLDSGRPEGVTVLDNAVEPAIASPYVWSLEIDGARLSTSGYLPDEELRSDLAGKLGAAWESAGFDVARIADKALIAAGAPDGFPLHAEFAAAMAVHLQAGKLSVEENRLTVTGTARSPDHMDALDEMLSSVPDGLSVAPLSVDPAVVDSYGLEAKATDGRLELTGFVESREQREILATLAGDPGKAGLSIALGAPTRFEWRRAALFAIDLARNLDSGIVSLSADGLAIDGRARDPEAHRKLKNALGGILPPGMAIVSANIMPPVVSPYRLSLRPVGGGFILAGFAPDESTREIIRDMAALRFSGKAVAGELEIAGGEPRGFLNAINVGLQTASRLEGGAMMLSGQELKITGNALYESAEGEIAAYIRDSLPPDITGVLQIGVLGEPTIVNENKCLEDIQAELVHGRVLFESARAAIREESFGLLDRIIYQALRCPEARFRIGGHTDSDGSEEFNQKLSQKRAESVKSYLVEAGMSESNLVAWGYGESRPVADNETEEGKAQNRRITFELLLPPDTDTGRPEGEPSAVDGDEADPDPAASTPDRAQAASGVAGGTTQTGDAPAPDTATAGAATRPDDRDQPEAAPKPAPDDIDG